MLVDIFHDTACPWCRIGIKHLLDALGQWHQESVELRWHPFLLDRSIPAEGIEFRAFMQVKRGIEPEALEQLFHYIQHYGKAAGVRFNFDKITLAVNTELSHRLIALAPKALQLAIVQAIYKAYFENGFNIGDLEVLVSIGTAVDMNPAQLRQSLRGDAALQEVIRKAALARRKGIFSLPCFKMNNQISLTGSQPPKAFIRAFNRAALLSSLNPPYWA